MTSVTQGKHFFPVIIASGQTASASAQIGDLILTGFILPAAFTGTAVTFQGSLDNITFYTIYDSTNTALTATVTQGRAYTMNLVNFTTWPYMKIVSGSAEGADRTVTLLVSRALNPR